MYSLIDMNGRPTRGKAIWQVKNISGNILFEGTEKECREFKNGIHAVKGYYLNARPDYNEIN